MHSWSRDIDLHIKVRDLKFWEKDEVRKKLDETLSFMTGDWNWNFKFYQHSGEIEYELFGDETFVIESEKETNVVLFSGGLDSLSGIIELLRTTDNQLCLVSHQSGNPSVGKVQNDLFDEIKMLYPGRCYHYKYECSLRGQQSADETQRTRSFLFNSIAYTLASTYKLNENILFENAITSFNIAETQDMINSRSSRTTHPKTLGLMSELMTMIHESEYKIKNRFYDKTKADVIAVLKRYGHEKMLDIAVSCSGSRNKKNKHTTHCGICSQCIDRRFGAYYVEVEEEDENGIYDFDFVKEDLLEIKQKKAISDYLLQARKYSKFSLEKFYDEFTDELTDLEEFFEGETEADKIQKIYNVCLRHGGQVEKAYNRMQLKNDGLNSKFRANSLFSLVLGMRTKEDILKPIKLNAEGIEKIDVPRRQLKILSASIYQNLLEKGEIGIKEKETKLNKGISNSVILELEKEYKMDDKQKNSIHEYFRKGLIEAKRKNGKIEVKTHAK